MLRFHVIKRVMLLIQILNRITVRLVELLYFSKVVYLSLRS